MMSHPQVVSSTLCVCTIKAAFNFHSISPEQVIVDFQFSNGIEFSGGLSVISGFSSQQLFVDFLRNTSVRRRSKLLTFIYSELLSVCFGLK